MAKEWTTLGTNALEVFNLTSKYEKIKREKKFKDAIKNTPVLKKYSELEEQVGKDEKLAENRKKQLLEAYDKKVLKSKRLIKEAKALKKKSKNKGVAATA